MREIDNVYLSRQSDKELGFFIPLYLSSSIV
jgi:hypothetical protein